MFRDEFHKSKFTLSIKIYYVENYFAKELLLRIIEVKPLSRTSEIILQFLSLNISNFVKKTQYANFCFVI